MNPTEIPPLLSEIKPKQPATAAVPPAPAPGLPPLMAALWKFFVGGFLASTFVGSFLVVGWSYRAVQRLVLRSWWRQSRAATKGTTFAEFATGSHLSASLAHWPNWLLQQQFSQAWPSAKSQGFRARWRAVLSSFWQNARIGVQGIFNTWVLTLPAGLMWWFSWFAGWNNSFHKGYEDYFVGISIAASGIAWFIAAMFYVPMAQMRQAVTGDWRAFYQFRTNWKLIRNQWLPCLVLAGLFSAATLPVIVVITFPRYFEMFPSLSNMNADQAVAYLQGYYFWLGFYVFTAYVGLRLVAAKIYASAVLSCVRRGTLTEDELSRIEWEALTRLDHFHVRPSPVLHPVLRIVTWAGTRVGRMAVGFAMVWIWFSLVAQMYISQFLSIHLRQGWLNQPMIQLPWSDYTPQANKETDLPSGKPPLP